MVVAIVAARRREAILTDARTDPAILFVHGFPLDNSLWRHTRILSGHRIVAPDLAGFGARPFHQRRSFSIARHPDDLMERLNALGIASAVVCGLSMGGYVAFEIYRRYPDRVSALVLVSTRAEPDSADGRTVREEMIELVEGRGVNAVADRMQTRLVGPDASPTVVTETRDMILRASPLGMVAALEAMRDRVDSRPMLGHIRVPTMVVAGSADLLIPVDASRDIAARVASASLEIVAGVGHLVPIENPGAFMGARNRFLTGLT